MWKVSGSLLLLLALGSGAVLFTWFFSGRVENTNPSGQTRAQSGSDRTGESGSGFFFCGVSWVLMWVLLCSVSDLQETLSRISSGAKAAVHLEGSCDEEDGGGSGGGQRLRWRADQGQAFDQGGFRLWNGSVVVPRSGLYFVYSQASFRVACGAGPVPVPLSHGVWRHSDSQGGGAPLMSAVRSACRGPAPADGRGWYDAVYLGGVFQLRRGDRLWTETNRPTLLETDDGRTFFGAFAL
ncbi:tumor necrosis factor-like isoform X1 [Salarias fasciatus]|uniref:tumor necrosis factor-like isoform X1 n=1 Tax=Salarias fasciatus TaxID=181472 RepID=UPI0011766844|nr:tumor necrosis factor-like isoform X1 [Salarias fasciatus]